MASSPVVVKSKTGQYWVVNTSPPGNGPGGAALTQYTIVEGTQADAESMPNGGGISGPYGSLQTAYKVWRNEPGNTNTSTLQTVLNDLGVAYGALTSPAGGTAENASSDATKGGEAANDQWSLVFGNTAGLLTRILKVVFGGILIISGVVHMTGATQKLKSALGPAGMAVLAA